VVLKRRSFFSASGEVTKGYAACNTGINTEAGHHESSRFRAHHCQQAATGNVQDRKASQGSAAEPGVDGAGKRECPLYLTTLLPATLILLTSNISNQEDARPTFVDLTRIFLLAISNMCAWGFLFQYNDASGLLVTRHYDQGFTLLMYTPSPPSRPAPFCHLSIHVASWPA